MAMRQAATRLSRPGVSSLRPVAAASSTLPAQLRLQSTAAQQEPKAKANALIEALPGNSLVSKTGSAVLGIAVAGAAVSSELYVVNPESIILGSSAVLFTFLAGQVRGPYREWADSQINKILGILNASRAEHTQAVEARIADVSEMKDSVEITKALFAMSKETAKLEHEAFALQQKTAIAAEIKATLDSWVRYEAQARESEQAELVSTVINKVMADLQDPKVQKDILASAVAEVEGLVKEKKI